MDLANYKKVWKDQPEEKNKISSLEIYKMTQSRSISIAKWIFMIGLIEFIKGDILKLKSFVCSTLFWDFPGKRNLGYCREKDIISTKNPFSAKDLAIASLKSEIPPLSGEAGPTIMILVINV